MDSGRAIELLKDGNRRHTAGEPLHPRQNPSRRTELVPGQKPWAAVVGCADSRVPPEIVFDQGLGDLFVIRTAGHVVDAAVLASIEYAVEHLNVPLVVVLGHRGCGAVAAALQRRPDEAEDCLCAAIRPAIARARLCPGDLCDQTVRAHVQGVADGLRQTITARHGGRAAVVG
ncbi:MAG: carbonic anhydrase, partial [Candidatus Bipolaricaulota bacterium]